MEYNVKQKQCTSCYYYLEDIDMGAIIHWCSKHHTYCGAVCGEYISQYDVDNMVDKYISRRNNNGEQRDSSTGG